VCCPAGSGSGLGFCRGYSFNTGDLTTCGDVLLNYLEAYDSIPWDDLRYMFGEVRRGSVLSNQAPGAPHACAA
jgi:dynein heavy chain